jgi:transcriptional regulator with XRE-family HTH domain
LSKYHLSAEEVRRIRRSLGETQAQFAERLCVDAVTVARWETNQRQCTGLYAKTIAELDPGNSPFIKKDTTMEEEQEIRTVPLDQVFSLTSRLAPILEFFYKEVPEKHRNQVLEAYQQWFEIEAYRSEFFNGVCNQKLLYEIGYFCRPILKGPMHPNQTNNYGKEKLAKSHIGIHAIAKQLAPNCESARNTNIAPDLEPRERYIAIQFVLDDLLAQSNLKEGDLALLKFYRALLNFAFGEMNKRKPQPIPVTLSLAFQRVLTITLNRLITISVPEFDDDIALKCLSETTMELLINRR